MSNTKHIKTWGDLGCSGRVRRSCSTCGTRHVSKHKVFINVSGQLNKKNVTRRQQA